MELKYLVIYFCVLLFVFISVFKLSYSIFIYECINLVNDIILNVCRMIGEFCM